MTLVLILGLVMNAIALPIAARRIVFLYRLITSGQPAPDRVANVRDRVGETIKDQVVKVLGQKKLLQWTVPGAAHFFVFWAFLILATVYLEAYGSLFQEGFAIPLVGRWDLLGFAQDFIAVMALVGLAVFATIRLRNRPEKLGRKSRFEGSHLGGAWLVLLMISLVVISMFLFRGAGVVTGNFPYGDGAFMSHLVGSWLEPLGEGANETLEHVGLLAHIGVMLVFLIIVLNSKHLHIFVAPLNVMFGRRPIALGAVKPMTVRGKPVDMEAMENLEEDDFEKLGIGTIEDFSWKGMLDFASCTECGRCQDQCPAWNTEKPLSPKLLIMGLRDHAFAKAPYLLADSDEERANLSAEVIAEAERALVGETEGDAWHPTGGAVIDPDVLWSCVNCGACVEQCPVDIEHVDHIDDMRRYQVLVESNFPTELNNIFKGLERKGNPWGMDPSGRMDWAKNLDFPVKQVGVDVESLDEVEWLFWVGCAGAFEDRAKKTTQAVAELLNMAGVDFAVLGDGETCTGDPARRAGNEIVFMQLAMENAEVFKETKVKKVVSTCAHCFNTLKNEYSEFGVELEVVHHTQLLNRLVQEKRLTPVAPTTGAVDGKTITYHDPCFLGRHNKVYAPPRELLEVIPGATFTEMPRNSERSFCCGGGGARMWMEETIGSRINTNRTEEAVATGADQIAVGCPFCRVMLTDGLTAQQAEGKAREEVEVLDVAQMLLASVKRDAGAATEAEPNAEDRADDASISSTAAAAPAADAHLEGDTTEPSGSDQEDAAKHNVALDEEGGGHEMSGADEDDEPAGEDVPAVEEVPEPDPEPEPGDATEADDEAVPEESGPEKSGDEPEIPAKPDDGDESPAEEVTHVPDESEPVEEESREEEADTVPFSDPQPSSSEVSDKATELSTDDEGETPKNS